VSAPIGSTRRRINLAASKDYSDEKSNGGYDSDGVIGPFFDAVAGEINTYDETIIDHEAPVKLLTPIETPVVLIQEQPEKEQLEQGPEHEQPIEQEQHVQQEPVQVTNSSTSRTRYSDSSNG